MLPAPTIVQRFLHWASTASANQRAEATSALARAYLTSFLAEGDRRAAEAALTLMLDDVSPLVRAALAMAMCASPEAPRHIVLVLATDLPDIAATVVEFSPVPMDVELMALLPGGDPRVHEAAARRAAIGPALAARLVEEAEAPAVITLLRNAGARLWPGTIERVVERHGDEPAVRDILLARTDLPAALRQKLVARFGAALAQFAQGRTWLGAGRAERIAREACERETVRIAAEAADHEVQELAAHLRQTGGLTPGFLVQVALAGGSSFVAAALAQLAGVPRRRAERLIADRSACGFEALAGRAGLAAPAVRMLALACNASAAGRTPSRGLAVDEMLERLPDDESADTSRALLRRYAVDVTRDEARALASVLRVAA